MMHAIIAYNINTNRIVKAILTFFPKLTTYHYFFSLLSSTKSFNKVYKGNHIISKVRKINNKHNIISHGNKFPSFSFKNIFQIKIAQPWNIPNLNHDLQRYMGYHMHLKRYIICIK